jgi:hypothetical protein
MATVATRREKKLLTTTGLLIEGDYAQDLVQRSMSETAKSRQPSVITAKAANDYHFETGQRK